MTLNLTPGQKLRAVNSKTDYRLGDFIAAGGEGSVYALSGQPDRVAKLYPAAMNRDRVRRLSATIDAATPRIRSIAAWPEDILVTRHRAPVGFVMPRVDNATPLHQLISPTTRIKERPNHSYASLMAIAENLSRAVATLHQDNIVIGDINGQNFLVLPDGTVRVIDCDSMQVGVRPKWYPEVNVEDYLPPELQGKRLSKTLRTPSHDVFSLAVVIFQLLIMGRHPFAGNDGLDLRQAIAQRRHAFYVISPEHSAFKLMYLDKTEVLTAPLIKLFSQTFDHKKGSFWCRGPERPTAEEWVHALSDARSNLQACSDNAAHYFISGSTICPWCEMEERGVPAFFAKIPTRQTLTAKVSARTRSARTLEPYLLLACKSAKRLVPVAKFVGKVIYEVCAALAEIFWPVLEATLELLARAIVALVYLLADIIAWAIGIVAFVAILSFWYALFIAAFFLLMALIF